MTHHVIIGGGPAATNAIETIRQVEADRSQITLVSDEPAHSRMALPYWLSGQFPREHTHTADDAYFQKLGVDTRIGSRVTRVDPAANSVALDDGCSVEFDDLLIATGASPLSIPIPGADLPGVQPLWRLEHVQSAIDQLDGVAGPRVVLVGGGFIGFIVLNAMFKRGWRLTVVEREAQVLPRMLDAASAQIVESWLESRGVAVHAGVSVQSISAADDGSKNVQLADGTTIEADLVVLAVGIQPNLGPIDGAGIDVDQGILVNDRMQSSVPNIYAAGDVAQGPVLYGDDRAIHAIQPTAVDHGRVAGANMAGQQVRYPGSLSMNITDVCGLQCASFGNWESAGDATVIHNPDHSIYRKYCWDGESMVGAIFLGRPSDMGMLTDVGMVKGILQSQTPLGRFKEYLAENPFDVRKAYVACNVAGKLRDTTLLGRPSQPREYHPGGVANAKASVGPSHAVYVGTK